MREFTIGIDISKASLDVHRLPDGVAHQFNNDGAGHAALIAWLEDLPENGLIGRVVYEPTGAYHRLFEKALDKAGLTLCRVDPMKARGFARISGNRAKTDPIDARMLAQLGQTLPVERTKLPSQTLETARQLIVARRGLIKDRIAAKNRRHQQWLPLLKEQIEQRLDQIKAQIGAIEAELETLRGEDKTFARRCSILKSMPGLKHLTATTMLAEMPELGTMDKRQVASLAGLAPFTRQSGNWKGQSHIFGGRANLRHALYMPALVAARFNPDLKAFYDRLIAEGKPSKVAIVAVMRKMIIIANSLIRDDREWTPNRP